MTKLIAYHKDCNYLALFESDGEIWVGEHDPYLTHQNSEPHYDFLFSCSSIDRGLEKLNALDPNELY